MIHHGAIEQAIERQLEIERKAAAWDRLRRMLQPRTPSRPMTADHMLDLMAALEQDAARVPHA